MSYQQQVYYEPLYAGVQASQDKIYSHCCQGLHVYTQLVIIGNDDDIRWHKSRVCQTIIRDTDPQLQHSDR